MSMTTRSERLLPFLTTLLLGLVMAAGLWVVADPAVSWIGFAMAAALRSASGGRHCLPGVMRRAGG